MRRCVPAGSCAARRRKTSSRVSADPTIFSAAWRWRGDDGAQRRDAALFFPGVGGRAKDGRCQIVRRVCFAGGAFGKANAERLLKARKQLDALEAAEAKVAIEVR